jgi:hypothetical protein
VQETPDPVFINVEYIFMKLWNLFGGFFEFLFSVRFLIFLKVFGTIIIILLITAVLYCLVRLYEIKQESKKKKGSSTVAQTAGNAEDAPPLPTEKHNTMWDAIRAKLLSDSPSDWRLAIIEADIYMDKILDQQGFHGDTVGDKLKQVTPDKLNSINMAWEAHKVRNRIAHEGSAFNLTMPEARRILSYYEIIFRDLGVIE